MNETVKQNIRQSAADFQNIVWPDIRHAYVLQGSTLRQVEANNGIESFDPVDVYGGVDAWVVNSTNSTVRGLASRVQRGTDFQSFSIRFRTPYGNKTEYHKRLEAIHGLVPGALIPHFTAQAYVSHEGNLLSWGLITTRDLFLTAEEIVNSGDLGKPEYQHLFGLRTNTDGGQFLYLTWNFIDTLGLSETENVSHY